MKKRFGVAALALAAGCAIAFAGCTGCNGCGANEKSNEAAFSSNWYADTGYRYIQPTFTGVDKAEVVKYKVVQDKETAGNSTYSVEYSEGEYVTTFYATAFDKTLIAEDYKSSYPENDFTVYAYFTELSFPSVTFKVGDDTKIFNGDGDNTVKTVCYFTDVNNHLRPLYSEQNIKVASPADYQVGKIENAYKEINQTVKTYYKYDGKEAKTVITGDNATEFTVQNLGDTNYSLIDVNGLNIAVRAMQLGTNLNQVISVYSPTGRMQNYGFAGTSSTLAEPERKSYEEILAGKDAADKDLNLFTPGEGKALSTVCVTATLNADMKGVSQKYWFAAIDNAKNNQARATMVKMSVPIPFSLGTLNYTLKEITSTLY